jgi:hypothetical protein
MFAVVKNFKSNILMQKVKGKASFTPSPFYHQANSSQYPLEGSRLGSKAGQNAVERREISCPYRQLKPDRSSLSPLQYRLSYPGFHSFMYTFNYGMSHYKIICIKEDFKDLN